MDNKGGMARGQMMPGESQVSVAQAPMAGEMMPPGMLPNSPENMMPAGEQLPNPEMAQAVNMEMPPMQAPEMAQQPAAPAPEMNAAPEEPGETPALTELRKVEVARNAEKLPKAYEVFIKKIIDTDKNDPAKLLADLDEARWDMNEKRHARKLGDGLHGGGAN